MGNSGRSSKNGTAAKHSPDDTCSSAERSGLSVFAAALLAQPFALVITILIVKVTNVSWLWGLLIFLVVAPLTVVWLAGPTFARNAKAAQKKEAAAKQSLQGSPEFSAEK